MKVLIAHEADIGRKIFETYCKKLDFIDCQGCKHPEEAVEMMSSQNYDLVILPFDWVAQSTRTQQLLREKNYITRVLTVTTDYSIREDKWCEQNGIAYYVQLPISFNVFKLLVSESSKDAIERLALLHQSPPGGFF